MKITPESVFGIIIFAFMILMEIRAVGQIRQFVRHRQSGAAWGLSMGIAMFIFAGCLQIVMAVEVIPEKHASPPMWIYYVMVASIVVIIGSILKGAIRLLH